MRVVVAKPYEGDSVAEWALRTEGLEVEARYVTGDLGYAELWAELWAVGESFVLVEHDVVPWPGAVVALANCEQPVCTHRYAIQQKLVDSLGFIKVSEAAMGLPLGTRRFWTGVELTVQEALATEGLTPHVHEPGVAHVKPPEGYTGPVASMEVRW